MINPDDLAIAREWAEHHSHTELVLDAAAVRVIQALPNQVADAAKIHKLIEQMKSEVENPIMQGGLEWEGGYVEATDDWVRELEALLPAPPRRPAMIKRGALAVHPEHGEVLVISNRTKPNGDVEIVWDDEHTEDGTYWTSVPADSLTAPDEGQDEEEDPPAVASGGEGLRFTTDQTEWLRSKGFRPEDYAVNKDEDRRGYAPASWLHDEVAADQPKGDNPEDTPCNGVDKDNPEDGDAPGGIIPTGGEGLRFTTDQTSWLRSKGIRPEDYAADEDADQADVVRADGAPVEPTRSFPTGAHYDSEGNATEPEDVEPGEAWLVQTRYHDEPVAAIKRKLGTWVSIDRLGLCTWDDDRIIELIAPLVPKPEPRVLGTFKDYQDAAIGTIVRADDPDLYFNAWKRISATLWQSTAGYKQDNNEMSGTSRTTIWEPEEADQ